MGMHRRTAAKLIAGFGLTAAAMPVFAQGKTVEVSMGRGKMVFLPASITIASGDTVKWTNPAVVLHSVTFDPAAASLIASAPDLLAALELIYSNAGESPEWIRSRIGPVISKATGGTL